MGRDTVVGSCRMRAVLRFGESLRVGAVHLPPATRAFLLGRQAEPDLGRGARRKPPRLCTGLYLTHLPSCLAEPLPRSLASVSFLGWFSAKPEVSCEDCETSTAGPQPGGLFRSVSPEGRELCSHSRRARGTALQSSVSIWSLRTLEHVEAIITLTSQLW